MHCGEPMPRAGFDGLAGFNLVRTHMENARALCGAFLAGRQRRTHGWVGAGRLWPVPTMRNATVV